MNKVDSIRLIVFIAFAIGIYFYMGNMLAAQSSYLTRNYVKESHSLWTTIKEIEDPLYNAYPARVFLDNVKKGTLENLATRYDVTDLVEGLIDAYKNGNVEGFAEYKEKIAQKLRPIWRDAIHQERREKQERASKQGWFDWVKNNISSAAHRFYQYFFPATQKK